MEETKPTESDHANHLDEVRRQDSKKNNIRSELNAVKNAAKIATPMGAVSLLSQINFIGDMPYVAAMGAALLKDLITMVTFQTVILPIIFSILCSIFIFMMMSLVGANGKRKGANALLKKVGFLLGGGIFGSIPGLDIFPFETLTVVVIYVMELSERKNSHSVSEQTSDEDYQEAA